ncbi:toll-like receptor 1 [Mytilus galloprovincialis]|uniref:toll-like receptor 1 n=1 Tax=Mytilus galloprovincialis TaxID=29158 RepID=UPI003F7BFF1E
MACPRRFMLLVFICIYYDCSSYDKRCNFNLKKGLATCSWLTFIPRFPEYVTAIHFTNNTFYVMNKEFMSNLTKNNVTSLAFISNSIRRLYDDTFSVLPILKTLIIAKEKSLNVTDVSIALVELKSKLENVYLNDNDWTYIPVGMFGTKAFRNITKIILSKNKLLEFSFKEVANCVNLHTLDLSGNKLTTFDVLQPVNVKKIIVNGNKIVLFPSFCSKTNRTSNLRNLTTLFMNKNLLFELKPSMFECLPSLKYLQLNNNKFSVLLNNTFSLIPQLKELHIQSNGIKAIEPTALKSMSLQKLNFGQNGFRFDEHGRYNQVNIFKHIPKLTHLDLTGNFLRGGYMPWKQMFSPLQNLIYLNLHATHLKELPTYVFCLMMSLQQLILQGNSLLELKEGTFDNMSNLQYLNLEGNSIQSISPNTFPMEMLLRLKGLDLSNNPFLCTCDIMWFRDWLRNKNKTRPIMTNYPQRFVCMYPENMRGKHLIKYNPTKEICTHWNQLHTIAIILSSFAFITITLLVIVYRCNANIRNYFYLFRIHRLKRQGYISLNSSEDYEYHAFVVYCDADREWVHKILLRKLEDEGLNLCIHDRDFDVGASITENIDTYLQKCWKIIVIMSNEFAKSEWCQWEVDFVQERRRQQGKDVFLLIMLKTINSNHMTCPVKTLIKTTPYLNYKGGVGEDFFWKAVVESIQKPLGDPPVAM